MAAVTGKKLKNTYKDLLQISNANSGIDTTLRAVEDCEGTTGALSMSTTVVGVLDGAVGAPGLEFKDDPDNGIYRIGANNWGLAVAGALAIELDPIGSIQMPLQPAFLARNLTGTANQTGDGGLATVVFEDDSVADRNTDFASNAFTAPVDGLYLLIVTVTMHEITTSMTDARIRIVTSNRSYYQDYNAGGMYGRGYLGTGTIQFVVIADMEAVDTAYVLIEVWNPAGGGSDTVDITGHAGCATYFAGCLLA
jgi:hypothetical protein|tara:strand:+ start:61 stop:816 length:756 start_codon:yes stop_codon:yes gene_type:complete